MALVRCAGDERAARNAFVPDAEADFALEGRDELAGTILDFAADLDRAEGRKVSGLVPEGEAIYLGDDGFVGGQAQGERGYAKERERPAIDSPGVIPAAVFGFTHEVAKKDLLLRPVSTQKVGIEVLGEGEIEVGEDLSDGGEEGDGPALRQKSASTPPPRTFGSSHLPHSQVAVMKVR